LAAALAAGETPSPEMVAAAPTRGTLSPVAALGAVAAVVILLVVLAILAESTRLYRVVALETPPDVLEDRAVRVLEAAGWGSDGLDSARGFEPDRDFSNGSGTPDEAEFWQRLKADPDGAVRFWYRRADRALVPAGEMVVSPDSPPLNATGDALVALDATGRLRRLVVVPEGGLSGSFDPIDWTPLLEASGFDPATLEAVNPSLTPPVYADDVKAWLAPPAEGSDIRLRIEGAGHRGRAVSFDVVGPWTPSRLTAEGGFTGKTTAGLALLLAVVVSVVAAGIALARSNLRLGRGDRKGAARLALFVLVAVAASGMLGAHHVADFGGEYGLGLEIAALATFAAGLIWLLYIAIEPSLRRFAPHLLVAWSRLLRGDWRDPLVGRDVVLGGLLGMLHSLAISLSVLLPLWFADQRFSPVTDLMWDALASTRVTVAHIVGDGLVRGLFFALLVMTAYLLLLRLLRRPAAATAVLWLLVFLVPSLVFLRSWMMVPVAMLSATAMTVAALRLGLLGLASYHLFFITSNFLPLALDTRIWYAPRMVLSAGLIVGLAIGGARLATGKRKLLLD
jgi:serine/threonine-protein kinase